MARAAEPISTANLIGDYRYQDHYSTDDLHLDASGTYLDLYHGHMSDKAPCRGTWRLHHNGKVVLRGADKESRRIARTFGPFTVLPDPQSGLMLMGKRTKDYYGFGPFHRVQPSSALPAAPAAPATPAT